MNMKDFTIGVATGIALTGAGVAAVKMYNWIVSGEAVEDVKEAAGAVVYKSFAMVANGLTMETLYDSEGRIDKGLREALAVALAYYATVEDLDQRENRKHLDFIDRIDDIALRAVVAKEAKRILNVAYAAKQEDETLELNHTYFASLFD